MDIEHAWQGRSFLWREMKVYLTVMGCSWSGYSNIARWPVVSTDFPVLSDLCLSKDYGFDKCVLVWNGIFPFDTHNVLLCCAMVVCHCFNWLRLIEEHAVFCVIIITVLRRVPLIRHPLISHFAPLLFIDSSSLCPTTISISETAGAVQMSVQMLEYLSCVSKL